MACFFPRQIPRKKTFTDLKLTCAIKLAAARCVELLIELRKAFKGRHVWEGKT